MAEFETRPGLHLSWASDAKSQRQVGTWTDQTAQLMMVVGLSAFLEEKTVYSEESPFDAAEVTCESPVDFERSPVRMRFAAWTLML